MERPKLSIVMPTLLSRAGTFYPAIAKLIQSQLTDEVEFLALADQQGISIGAKVDWLYRIARGKYITAVGDDDRIAPDYVKRILETIDGLKKPVDVIVFDVGYNKNGRRLARVRYGIEVRDSFNDFRKGEMERWPDEKMAIRSPICKKVKHDDLFYGEDMMYARALRTRLRTQERIDAVLYEADYRSDNPERMDRAWRLARERTR